MSLTLSSRIQICARDGALFVSEEIIKKFSS